METLETKVKDLRTQCQGLGQWMFKATVGHLETQGQGLGTKIKDLGIQGQRSQDPRSRTWTAPCLKPLLGTWKPKVKDMEPKVKDLETKVNDLRTQCQGLGQCHV